jgi:CheY-like chemotaxis protein
MEKKPRKKSALTFEDKKNILKRSHHKLHKDNVDFAIPHSILKNKGDSAIAIPISSVSHHRLINAGPSLNILVAEDNDLSYLIVKFILDRLNVIIHHAKNGIEALEMVKSNHIDLVLMDIKMPLLNGIEATRKIREIIPEMPVIALSAYHDDNDILRSFQAGCDDFIAKPISSSLLISKITFWNF